MKNKKILLVGGCGFIGHNLSLNLKKKGAIPIVVDSLSVNNILSFADNEIKNKKLYSAILNNRIELLNSNGIEYKKSKIASKLMKNKNIELNINLNSGNHSSYMLTNDIGINYVKFNSSYTT